MTKNNAWPLGALSPGKRDGAKNYMMPPLGLPTPTRICNAASQGIYTGPAWNIRPNSDHSHLPSKGGC